MVFGVFGAEISFIEASNCGRAAVEESFINRDSRSPLDGVDISEPRAERQERFAETEVGRIPARQPGETGASIDTLGKGCGGIEDPSFMRIGRTVPKIERLR